MDCQKVSLVVNGASVELNQFAGQVLGNTILGLVQSLRLDSFPKEIEVRVTAAKPEPTSK